MESRFAAGLNLYQIRRTSPDPQIRRTRSNFANRLTVKQQQCKTKLQKYVFSLRPGASLGICSAQCSYTHCRMKGQRAAHTDIL